MELAEEKIALLKSLYVKKWFRKWLEYMERYKCDTTCEIGVRMGMNFNNMIEHNPRLAVAIDCWIEDGVIGRNDTRHTQEELDKQYENFKNSMSDKKFVKIYRGYSFNVVKEFPDEYFDFIFIDADHTYDGVKRDLIDWYPKVKKGGVFCGHDYVHRSVPTSAGTIKFGVVEAVDEFVVGNKLPNFFVLKPSTWGLIK